MPFIVEPCASAKAFEIKFGRAIDIKKAAQALEKNATLISAAPVIILCVIDKKPVSIYASGRAMVKEATEKETKKIAEFLEKII